MPTRPRHPLATSVTAALTAAVLLAAPVAAADPTVTVKAGDTLSQLAVDHDTTVERLAAANALVDPNRILVGQHLVIPPNNPPAPAPAPPTPVAAALAAAPIVHVVASGENLTAIAARYATTVAAIASQNGLANPSFLLPGQRLVVGTAAPAAAPAAPAAATTPAAPLTHVVASGETLTGIAARYGTTITAIAAANGISNPSFIRTGTTLTIAGAPASASAGQAAAPSAPAAPPFATMPPDLRQTVLERLTIGQLIRAEAEATGVPPSLAMAVGWQESGWQQGLTSSAGAVGVMQLLPATGDWVAGSMLGAPVDVGDTASNIRAGVRLLKHYHDRYGGDRARILAAYYQGQFALETDGIYPVSWPYINAVLALEAMFAS